LQTTDKELNALISLLDEPNEDIFQQIRHKLLFYGMDAVPVLENAWDNSFDNLIQDRIEEIIHDIQQNQLLSELKDWAKNFHYDLLKGFYLVSKYQYPDLDYKSLEDKVEIIKRDIWLELNSGLTALEKVKVINHIFFEVHGFKGNKTNIDAPQNFFLNNLVESKKGNHISLGMLYIIIAQKLGIPIFGVDLPQHFVLAYVDEVHEEKYSIADENEVLFYINPFNKGAIFTKNEIEVYIKHLEMDKRESFFKPCRNVDIIIRLIDNLIKTYKRMGYNDKVDELNQLKLGLD
jgi:regulator of sirC expression with transglutaminase-like and TPR domain